MARQVQYGPMMRIAGMTEFGAQVGGRGAGAADEPSRICGTEAGRRAAIRVLLPIPCRGPGVAATCRAILTASAPRYALDLFAPVIADRGSLPVASHAMLPAALAALPAFLLRPFAGARLGRAFLAAVEAGQLAYLWPDTPLPVYRSLAARGIPIVAESLNTRMAVAKPRLDAAYEALGLPPAHPITDRRIAEQEERHALCSAIFAPSPATERAFAGTGLEARVIPASYGTWVPRTLPERAAKGPQAPVTFLFLGTACVRKGIQHLLTLWRDMPPRAVLRIVGRVEPVIRTLFADVMSRPNVQVVGFSRDVRRELLGADLLVLPSIEEGDAIVTYEAAAHGLPVVASPAGAGRIGDETGAIDIVDPDDAEAFRDRLLRFAASEELRRARGQQARRAALAYDWSIVGPRRFDLYFARQAG
ncbi:glycosyltransferase family 4 protein [Albidovulum sp.]